MADPRSTPVDKLDFETLRKEYTRMYGKYLLRHGLDQQDQAYLDRLKPEFDRRTKQRQRVAAMKKVASSGAHT